jgi:NET1-associated nuclear protein 1 (U3 small nucleolar RNA-associated protein 17)
MNLTSYRYLLLATERALKVYSIETSLLIRTFTVSRFERITTYALSRYNPDHVYIATSNKRIILADWTTGKEIKKYKIDLRVLRMQAVIMENSDHDTLFYVAAELQSPHYEQNCSISKVTIRKPTSKQGLHPTELWSHSRILFVFTVTEGGKYVIAASEDTLILGRIQGDGTSYIWQQIRCSEPVTSLDVQLQPKSGTGKKKSFQVQKRESSLNLVIGGLRGKIFLYMDLIDALEKQDLGGKHDSGINLNPRIMHWHREAVEAVKWSADGNYILSGGHETVFLLWQLRTGHRQELPHLSSPIISITVSLAGTSYALQLADNSVIVLSTSELQPKAHISGIQSRVYPYSFIHEPKLTTVTSLAEAADKLVRKLRKVPVLVNPRQPNQVFITVPSAQSRSGATGSSAAPYLQTYDTFNDRHITRQAMTRNNATVLTSGPGMAKLIEPDVTLIQISGDGKWLASVDEWMPPMSDITSFAESGNSVEQIRKSRRESYLKFWLWNEEKGHWILETRIDAPHRANPNTVANRILDLVSDPSGVGFATVGEDGSVRIWRPKTRYKDGTMRRGAHNDADTLITWSCQYTIELERTSSPNVSDEEFQSHSTLMNAKLAYSPDGSILAATQETSAKVQPGLVQLIDTATGKIHISLPSMYPAGLAGLEFCHRYLIVLSTQLQVWDIITNKLAYGFRLDLPSLPTGELATASQLVVNSKRNAFAMSVPVNDETEKTHKLANMRFHVLVFDPNHPIPLLATELPSPILAITPIPDSSGFFILDSLAETRIIAPRTSTAFATTPLVTNGTRRQSARSTELPTLNVDMIAGDNGDDDKVTDVLKRTDHEQIHLERDDLYSEDDKPIVKGEQLADALDLGPSFALPPAREMFEAVARLYGMKPKSKK